MTMTMTMTMTMRTSHPLVLLGQPWWGGGASENQGEQKEKQSPHYTYVWNTTKISGMQFTYVYRYVYTDTYEIPLLLMIHFLSKNIIISRRGRRRNTSLCLCLKYFLKKKKRWIKSLLYCVQFPHVLFVSEIILRQYNVQIEKLIYGRVPPPTSFEVKWRIESLLYWNGGLHLCTSRIPFLIFGWGVLYTSPHTTQK